MSKYAVIIEKSRTGYGASVPDLPGCFAAAGSLVEIQRLIRESIVFHIECLREEGETVPEPTTVAGMVDVPAA